MAFWTYVFKTRSTHKNCQLPINLHIKKMKIYIQSTHLLLKQKKGENFEIWLYLKISGKILPVSFALMNLCQSFDNCIIKCKYYKITCKICDKLLFTKNQNANIFNQKCGRFSSTINLNQLDILHIELREQS